MSVKVLQQIWPDWKVEEKPIGRGSFGVVYKAVRNDHGVESYAAIKEISIPSDSSEIDSLRSEGLDMNATKTYLHGIVNDFVSEIQLMESLKGVQNIVSVEDYKVVEKAGEIGWDIYIRMELLTSFINYSRDKQLTEKEVIKLGCDICTALEICAKRNVIHRDIKPENIFINDFGDFKLGDFGIARKMENVTGGLSQKGTFNYMAPEVASSRDYDSRVDIYSLGIVLYRLLNANRLPFLETEQQLMNPNERRNAVERRLCGEALPAPCNASPAMANLILRACAYNPNARFDSAAEMRQALTRVANGTYQSESGQEKNVSLYGSENDNAPKDSSRTAPLVLHQPVVAAEEIGVATSKKKNKLPIVIATALAVTLLVGAGAIVLPKILKQADVEKSNYTNEEESSYTVEVAKLDEDMTSPIISEASRLAEAGNFDSAIKIITDALETYGENTDLRQALASYSSAYKEKILAEADSFATDEKYLDAIAIIDIAQKILNDANLQKKKNEYEELYIECVMGVADDLISQDKIKDADASIKEALNKYPNNEKLKTKAAQIETLYPVPITTLTAINSENWNWNDGIAEDPFGNNYSSGCNYAILKNGSYRNRYSIEYRANKKYSSISGIIAPHDEMAEDGYCYVQVFADDVLVYTSPTVHRKTDSFTFNADITEADYIIIKVYVEWDSSVIVSDVTLTVKSVSDAAPSGMDSITSSEEDNKGISITTLKIINQENWQWNDGEPKDIVGRDYTSVCNYAILQNGSYRDSYSVEYRVDGEYECLHADFAPHTAMSENGYAYIQVLADDVLIYTSSNITNKTDANSIDLDITGTKYIKIQVYVEWDSAIILSNVTIQ